MDFEKIKPAVEEIQLSDSQKKEIINACRGKKRKFNYKPLAIAAAAAAIVIAVFSPGFLLRAGSPDLYAEVADENFFYLADSYNNYDDADMAVVQNASSALGSSEIFQSAEHRPLYSVIPSEFISLVDFEEFKEWESAADADDGAAIFQFIKHFAVSREEFENANKKFAERLYRTYGKTPVTYPDEISEHLEIFNTEIIFSLDKEKISDYYLCPDYANLKSPAITVSSDYYQ